MIANEDVHSVHTAVQPISRPFPLFTQSIHENRVSVDGSQVDTTSSSDLTVEVVVFQEQTKMQLLQSMMTRFEIY
jgi:hypothetical protein